MTSHEITQKNSSASSGVEALINRLRKEGVAKGRTEAEQIMTDARKQADSILKEAEEEARAQLEKARQEAKQLKESGKEALRVAARDMILDMKGQLMHSFTTDVKRLVRTEMKEKDVIKQLILEVAARAKEDTGLDKENSIEVLLPRSIVGLEDLRRKPEELQEGTLSHFVLVLANNMLRQGISFNVSDDLTVGIKLRLLERNIEIDLTDEAVAMLLLQHLQPRFRALLEGIVK